MLVLSQETHPVPRTLLKILGYGLAATLLVAAVALVWLHHDAGKPLEPWFEARHGALAAMELLESEGADEQRSELITLTSDSGLAVTLRVFRHASVDKPLPVLMVLGGHRTGSDAANLFGDVGKRAIIALDYPYEGPERVRGIIPIAKTIPLARQAFRDTPPAVELVVDWLTEQSWVDHSQIVIVGASLGVPFAALAAARDERISGLLLVHGAADNEKWIEIQIARRNDFAPLHKPVAKIIHWMAYGPTYDTARNVAAVAPRPVLIIGARDDERTPAGQTEKLFAAAGEPKWLRWTEGAHIQPGRQQIVADLLAIADEMLPFPTAPQ